MKLCEMSRRQIPAICRSALRTYQPTTSTPLKSASTLKLKSLQRNQEGKWCSPIKLIKKKRISSVTKVRLVKRVEQPTILIEDDDEQIEMGNDSKSVVLLDEFEAINKARPQRESNKQDENKPQNILQPLERQPQLNNLSSPPKQPQINNLSVLSKQFQIENFPPPPSTPKRARLEFNQCSPRRPDRNYSPPPPKRFRASDLLHFGPQYNQQFGLPIIAPLRQQIELPPQPQRATKGHAVVYTDGAYANNKAGIGVWWGSEDDPRNVSEPLYGRQTINRAQLRAAIVGINSAADQGYDSVTVCSDSDFLIRCGKYWIYKFKKNCWKLPNNKRLTNQGDFLELFEGMNKIKVLFEKVRQREPGNEAADRLATQAIRDHRSYN